ncbi:DUF3320 domain-containing protein [Modestobacter lapidis]
MELTTTPVLSSALAHAGVPVVSRLALGSSGGDLRAALVRLTVADAEGPIGAPVERLVDLTAGRTTVLGDVGLTLDPAAMLQVPERRPGWVRVEVEVDGRLRAQRRVPVHVLPAGQWLATPLPLALEMLAAHVQPQHPAVTELLAEAAEVLEGGTGSAQMDGYQVGPERVDDIVDALAAVVHRRGIRYGEAPASWTDLGQDLRPVDEVLAGGVATCLDTVLVLAAACEAAGLRPLLWLVSGGGTAGEHAFLGYWREERSAETVATTDVAGLVDQVTAGRIRLVETSLLTAGRRPVVDLHGPAAGAWLTGDLSRVLGVTDVHRARTDGVLPLPARTRDADGGLRVVEYRPAVPAAPATAAPPAVPDNTAARAAAPARVQQWKNALLDLSLRNRLVNYTGRAGLPLAVPAPALPTLADALHGGAAITLLPATALPAETLIELLRDRGTVHADVPASGYLPRLRGLAHKARTLVEETGANNLYLALGSLAWELDGRALRSPLVLVPVVLTSASRGGAYRLTLDEAGVSTPNWCLLEKLRQVHGLTVPGLGDPATDGGVDVTTASTALRAALARHGLPFRVEPTADLAVLQFAKYRLWKDLDEHWAELAANPLVAHLVQAPGAPFADPVPDPVDPVDLDELAARLPVPADASQLQAVAAAAAGQTFVLEGPPGTGKSQTITNLLTRAVADGKRVLFVAEKRAALDVVARRLEAVGMGPFALDLHDKGSRPAAVRAQVRAALEHAVEVDAAALAADDEALRAARRGLDSYADRLHSPNAVGLSFYSARTAVLSAGDDVPALPVPAAFVAGASTETLTAVRRALALLPDIADLARPSAGHAWAFIDTIILDITAVQQSAVEVDRAIRALPAEGPLAALLRAVRTPEHLDTLVHVLAGPAMPLAVLDEVRTERWVAAAAAVTGEVAALVGTAHPGLDVATPEALALPLGQLFVEAQTAAATGRLGRRTKLGAIRAQLAPVLQPGARVRRADVPELTASLFRVQTAVQGIASRASGVPGLRVPATWNPFLDTGRFLLDAEVVWLRRAAAAVGGTDAFTVALRRFLAVGPAVDPAAVEAVARVRNALQVLLGACSAGSAQLDAWSGADGLVLRWTMTRPERGVEYTHPMSLRRWVSLLDTLEPLRAAGLTAARTALLTGSVRAEDAVRALDRGLAEASVVERRQATGLGEFDAELHERMISRFATASRAVREHLVTALPADVLAARPFDPTSADGPVGALRRELDRTRGGLGVRGLLGEHGALITSLLPCVLVSPDSVARFFPAVAGQFDLVVFDEASQIRVADAVGALGRARAAVVVGDSKQMPPTSVAEPVAGPDGADAGEVDLVEDAGAVQDEESILSQCVQAGVPRHWLSWHYRSQDESLIAFSNAEYYERRLNSFPAPVHGAGPAGAEGLGVSLVQVGGTFHRSGTGRRLRTNPVEASAVVSEVLRRFEASPHQLPSIGVVTFNAQQRTHIEELLRDCGDERVVEALDRTDGEGLFVKNLENVQGDERDVVFFSTGFSPDARGKLPLNFGPLNRTGGERRLNVAVTRARRQVVVFCSFAPEQLRAEDTASVGVKHLRAYLDLAAMGTDGLARAPHQVPAPDRHREEIAAALRFRGLVVRTDVGLSDFRVDLSVARASSPDVPVLAVLLDGAAWAGRRTVGDRDGLPVDVLRGQLGWPAVERVWLPSWLGDPDAVLDRLVAAVEATPLPPRAPEVHRPARRPTPYRRTPEAGAEPAVPAGKAQLAVVPSAPAVPAGTPAPGRHAAPLSTSGSVSLAATSVSVAPAPADVPATPPRLTLVPAPVEVAAAPAPAPAPTPAPVRTPARAGAARPAALDGELPFVVWTPKPAGEKKVLDSLADAKAARAVRRVLAAGVRTEGPVHRDRLVRATAAAFGLSRVSGARRDALLGLLPEGSVVGDFVWPAGVDAATWNRFRRQSSSADRPLDQVAPEEIGNAMAALCRAAGGLTRSDLYVRTLDVFGSRRRTPALLPHLEAALTRSVAAGRLTEQPDGRITG